MICLCNMYMHIQQNIVAVSIKADSTVISLMGEADSINLEITLTVRFDNIQVWKEESESH